MVDYDELFEHLIKGLTLHGGQHAEAAAMLFIVNHILNTHARCMLFKTVMKINGGIIAVL